MVLVIVVTVIGLSIVFRQDRKPFAPQVRDDRVTDLLGWLPATDITRRAYAVWASSPEHPLDLTSALDTLALEPAPLALGRSSEWQQLTGVSASQVTGWASASGVTVLEGRFDEVEIRGRLASSSFSQTTHSGVDIWTAPEEMISGTIVAGDDLRALVAIAVVGDRIVIGHSVDLVRSALDAAAGYLPSLAEEKVVVRAGSDDLVGLTVVDSRDLAIECGVSGEWLPSDFDEPSSEVIAVVYRMAKEADTPVTSVWVEYPDELEALVGFTRLEGEWVNGSVNQMGLGGRVSDLASVEQVYAEGEFVVADLVNGRDNGWIRTGIRFLVGVCEHVSTLIPSASPHRATPVASPSPME